MVFGVAPAEGAKAVEIAGMGLTVDEPFELRKGYMVLPNAPDLDTDAAAKATDDFIDYASVIRNREFATFSLVVEEDDPKKLAMIGWNALWDFHLLALAAKRPCCSLYVVSRGKKVQVSAGNRNIMFPPLPVGPLDAEAIQWARDNDARFHALVGGNNIFTTAMRCYGNAHYLFDYDMRVMLLWSGIEGLLSVDAELTRRIGLYAALMLSGTAAEKSAHFDRVKKAYNIRSKAVHGGGATDEELKQGYAEASDILSILLRRCVELGRVPTAKEMDSLAASGSIA